MRLVAVTLVSSCIFLLEAASAQILVGSDCVLGFHSRFVQIDPGTGTTTVLGTLGDPAVGGLAWDPHQSRLYASSTYNNRLLAIDPATGATTVIGSFGAAGGMHGLEYDSVNHVLYGTSTIDRSLYSIDTATGLATRINRYWEEGGLAIDAMAFDAEHQIMYAATTGLTSAGHPPAGLYKLDLHTAAATCVGPFGAGSSFFAEGLAFDSEIGLFATDTHGADFNFSNELYRINPNTGAATLMGSMGKGNILGLAFVPEPSSSAIMPALLLLVARLRGRSGKES